MNMHQYLSYVKTMAGITHGSRAFGGPLQVRLAITHRCNIKCLHCYFHSPLLENPQFYHVRQARMAGKGIPPKESIRQVQSLEMDVDRLFPVLDEILSMGTRRFEITGRGEPFVHPSALDIIRIVKNAGCHCQVNTNGTLLDRGTMDALIQMEFDELRITTMGGSEEVYDRTHPVAPANTFNKLRQRLKYAAKQKERHGRRYPKITLATIIIKQNVDGLRDFARFAADVRADSVIFRPVDDIEDDDLAQLVPSRRQEMEVRRRLPDIKAYFEKKGIAHNIDYFLKVFHEQLDTRALCKVIPCYYGWLNPEIDPSGLVYACCRCYKIFGNAFEQGFYPIWKGNAYRRFRYQAKRIPNRLTYPEMSDCGSCTNHTANLKVYQYLHPLKSRMARMRRLAFPH